MKSLYGYTDCGLCSIPVSDLPNYPVPNSIPPIVLVDRTSHVYEQRQDPFRTLQGLFLMSHAVCAKPRSTRITTQERVDTALMTMLVMPVRGYPYLTWTTVCDAVRGMGEYVAQETLWYKLSFTIVENVSAGEAARRYGTLLTETLDSAANQGSGGGTAGDVSTAKRRALGGKED